MVRAIVDSRLCSQCKTQIMTRLTPCTTRTDGCLNLPANLSPHAAANVLICRMRYRLESDMQPATQPTRLGKLSCQIPRTEEFIHARLLRYPPTAHVPYGPHCENMTSSTKPEAH